MQARDKKAFEIEAKTGESLPRENQLCSVSGERFQSCLSVENSRQQHALGKPIECTAHEMSRVQIVEEGGTHDVPRLRQHAAGDRDIVAGLELQQQLRNLTAGIREVGIDKEAERASCVPHSLRDCVTLPSVGRVPQNGGELILVGESGRDPGSGGLAAIVDYNKFCRQLELSAKLSEIFQCFRETLSAVPGRNDDGDFRHPRQ